MKHTLLGFSVLLVAALSAACGTADQNAANNGGNGGKGGDGGDNTGGSSTGGTNTGGSNTGGANTGGSNTGGANTGGTNTGGSNTGGSTSTGGPCGGKSGSVCESSQFCDFPDDICGAADGQGECTPKPDACPDNVDPVCACDGKVYNNACEAQAAGNDLKTLGGCAPPIGEFPCGSGFCAKDKEYCEVVISDVGGEPNSYSCKDLPANCTSMDPPQCACLSDVSCGTMCQAADSGGLTVTCPGG
jgi:hypothetical protein